MNIKALCLIGALCISSPVSAKGERDDHSPLNMNQNNNVLTQDLTTINHNNIGNNDNMHYYIMGYAQILQLAQMQGLNNDQILPVSILYCAIVEMHQRGRLDINAIQFPQVMLAFFAHYIQNHFLTNNGVN